MLQTPNEDKKKKDKLADNSLKESGEETIAESIEFYNKELSMLHGNPNYEITAKSLDDLILTILDRDLTNENLNFIFKYLEPWLTSVNEWERLRSIRTLSKVLKYFSDNYKVNTENEVVILVFKLRY
jgi:hypothetical protein